MTTPEQETPEKIPQDRPFNPFRLPNSFEARLIVAEVVKQLQAYERHFGLRKRKRKKADQETFEATVTAVVCDLIHRALTMPQGWLAIPLSKQVLGRKTRYGSLR